MSTPAQLVQKYIALRDWLEADNKAVTARQEPYRTAMQTIEGAINQFMLANSLENLKTEFGTAYKTTNVSTKVADRRALVEDIVTRVQNCDTMEEAVGCLDILSAAIAKDSLKVYIEQHEAPPPGVEITNVVKVNFRRA